jgi:hypothetical protein
LELGGRRVILLKNEKEDKSESNVIDRKAVPVTEQ